MELQEVFKSLVKAYNNQEPINFIHLRSMEGKISNNLFDSFVDAYNNNKGVINFIHLRNLENEIK